MRPLGIVTWKLLWKKPFFANISMKTKYFSKIFWGVTQGPMYYWFMKKTRAWKSHAAVPLKGMSSQLKRGSSYTETIKGDRRAGHSLLFSRFALCSIFPWINIAQTLIFWTSRFAHRLIACKKAVPLKCSHIFSLLLVGGVFVTFRLNTEVKTILQNISQLLAQLISAMLCVRTKKTGIAIPEL